MPVSRFIFMLCKGLLSLLILFALYSTAHSQQQPYNRFQYHKFKWQVFHTDAFRVYFPAGCDSLARQISEALPEAAEKLRKAMGANMEASPNVIIYPSTEQMYESNIGMTETEDLAFPAFVYKSNRMLLAYNGNDEDLGRQVKLAVARSIWESQFRKRPVPGKPAGYEPVPYWFKEGALRYLALGWGMDDEDELYLMFRENRYTDWQQLTAQRMVSAGHAFCYFLSQKYNEAAVARTFFHLRKGKSLPRALRLVTKRDFSTLFPECLEWYGRRSGAGDTTRKKLPFAPAVSIPRKGNVRDVIFSPGGASVIYEAEGFHKRILYRYDPVLKRKKKMLVYRLPPFIREHEADRYPLLYWDEGSDDLLVTMPVKGKITTRIYNADGRFSDKREMKAADGVQTIIPLDRERWLMSAYRKGQSDLVFYNPLKEKYQPLTGDHWNDGQAAALTDKAGFRLYWEANRPLPGKTGDDSLRPCQGIFRIEDGKPVPVASDTLPYVRWMQPVLLQDGGLLVSHTITGTRRFALIREPDGTSPVVSTLGPWYPVRYDRKHDQITTFRNERDSLHICRIPLLDWAEQEAANAGGAASPWLHDYHLRMAAGRAEDSIKKAAANRTPSFLDGILRPQGASDSTKDTPGYDTRKTEPYVLQLYSAHFSVRINNDYFINRYQPYENYQGAFKFPEAGGMVQGGLSDLFENHHIRIAYRIPAGTGGSDFFVKYNNTAGRTDWGLQYFRKAESLQPDPHRDWVDVRGMPYPGLAKIKTHYYELFFHRPLSYDCSAELTTAIRKDCTVFLATERYSLEFPAIGNVWSISSLSLRKHMLQPTVSSLYRGSEAKGMIDVFKGFTGKESVLFGSSLSGAYHQPLYRYITLVVRARAGYSGGDEKILYNMGGIDNNITPRTDSSVHFPQDAPYAFQTLVTSFRGYYQNSLYGDRYVLLNADVYFPLFETLIPLKTPLSLIRHFQPGLLADVAGAGEGWRKPPANTTWLWSYGLSARTRLAGYPLRFDLAWPGSFDRKPVWYLSLTLH